MESIPQTQHNPPASQANNNQSPVVTTVLIIMSPLSLPIYDYEGLPFNRVAPLGTLLDDDMLAEPSILDLKSTS